MAFSDWEAAEEAKNNAQPPRRFEVFTVSTDHAVAKILRPPTPWGSTETGEVWTYKPTSKEYGEGNLDNSEDNQPLPLRASWDVLQP